jgi:hypothetical protein
MEFLVKCVEAFNIIQRLISLLAFMAPPKSGLTIYYLHSHLVKLLRLESSIQA